MTHSHPVAKKTTSWAWWALFHFLCLTSTADFLTVSAEAEDLSYMGSMDRFWRHHVETQTLEHKGVNYFPLIQSCLVERLSPEEWEAIPNVRSESRAVGRKVMMEEEDSSDDDHDTAVLVVVQKAIHPVHVKAVQTLAACVREHMPFLYESRALYKEKNMKDDPGLGGNCPTHISPLVAMFLPAVRQEMQRTLEIAFNAGGWKEWAEEDALNEVDSSDDEYMPHLDHLGIRASEHQTYADFPLLAPHTDDSVTKFTMNFALSGPEEYEGGEFYIVQNGEEDGERTYLKPNKYDAVVFLGGQYLHGVSEIMGGHREMFSTEFWNYPDIPFGTTLWTSLAENMEEHIRQCNEWEAATEGNAGPCMLEYPDTSASGYYCGKGNVAGECQPRIDEDEEDDEDSDDEEDFDVDGKEDEEDEDSYDKGDDFGPFKFSSYEKLNDFLYACKIAGASWVVIFGVLCLISEAWDLVAKYLPFQSPHLKQTMR